MTTKERLSGFFDDFGFEMSDDLIEKCKCVDIAAAVIC